jgi:hypothetical protein
MQTGEEFRWTAHRMGAGGRAQLPLLGDWVVPYVQVSGGIAWAVTRFRDPDVPDDVQIMFGPQMGSALGLQWVPRFGETRVFGLYGQAEWVTAPVTKNLFGDVHQDGGSLLTLGLRAGY